MREEHELTDEEKIIYKDLFEDSKMIFYSWNSNIRGIRVPHTKSILKIKPEVPL